MWLLDAILPIPLVHFLNSKGIHAETTEFRGWKHLSNGMLVSSSVDAGFSVILTRDVLFGEAAARALKLHQGFAVVVISFKDIKQRDFINEFIKAWVQNPIQPEIGKLVFWPK